MRAFIRKLAKFIRRLFTDQNFSRMRISIFTFLIISLLLACQDQRYTESSPEIEAYKKLIQGIEGNDYSLYQEIYSDTAKIYFNSMYPLTWQGAMEGMKISLEPYSQHDFGENPEFEFVLNDKGENWLGMWTIWTGTIRANGNVLKVPIHVTAQFIDGKIVEETHYWDNQIITEALLESEMDEEELSADVN